MNMKGDKCDIHVALAADDNYFEGLLTTAWTIAKYATEPERIVFEVLDGGITEEHRSFFERKIREKGSCCRFHPIDQESSFKGFREYHGASRMTYARLLLPQLLEDVDQVVYSDVDMAWFADVVELWDGLDDDAVMHVSSRGSYVGEAERQSFDEAGFRYSEGKYFIAGMIVMNLARAIFQRNSWPFAICGCMPMLSADR